MDENDQFSTELRAARERIAELQRRTDAGSRQGGGLLPEALAERERYRELFESAPVAYLVTDPMARIDEANRAAAALLGVKQRFLAGKPLAAYVASEDRWGFRSMVNRLHQGDLDQPAERPLSFRRRGGEIVATLATVVPTRDPDGSLQELRWLLRTVEPLAPVAALPVELAVEQDEARRGYLEALAELDPATDLDASLQVLLDAGVRLLDVDGVGMMLADAQGRLCAAGGSDEVTLSYLRAQEHLMKGPCVHAYLLERVVQTTRLLGDSRWPQLDEAAAVNGVAAVLATPIGLYGGPVGTCLLVSSAPRSWSEHDTRAAQAFAEVLAALLELGAEAQRSSAHTQRLQDILRQFGAPPPS